MPLCRDETKAGVAYLKQALEIFQRLAMHPDADLSRPGSPMSTTHKARPTPLLHFNYREGFPAVSWNLPGIPCHDSRSPSADGWSTSLRLKR